MTSAGSSVRSRRKPTSLRWGWPPEKEEAGAPFFFLERLIRAGLSVHRHRARVSTAPILTTHEKKNGPCSYGLCSYVVMAYVVMVYISCASRETASLNADSARTYFFFGSHPYNARTHARTHAHTSQKAGGLALCAPVAPSNAPQHCLVRCV